ncbi:MAG: GIY-YIG nuclease family protein [Candidatus Heimdallarchaeaceae archaeon]
MINERKWEHYKISIMPNSKTKLIEIENDRIEGLEFFRNSLDEIQNLDALSYRGVYILIGVNPSSEKKYSIYIGESKNLISRIKKHVAKDFWNRAVIFYKVKNAFDGGETKYIEAKLIEFLNETNKFDLMNKIEPSEEPSDPKKKDNWNSYLHSIANILHLLNYLEPDDFEDSESQVNQQENVIEIQLGSSKLRKLPRWKEYNLIPLNASIRRFFPKYKEEFIFETEIGEIQTYVTSTSGKPDVSPEDDGKYISKGLHEWFKYQDHLEPGDFLVITEIEPKKRYYLNYRKN